MGKHSVYVQLSDARAAYYSGQTISGKVIVEVGDELKVSAIHIKFNGYAYVRWSESHGSGKNRRTVTYSARENYINNIVTLVRPEHGEKDVKLHSGKFEYPFSFLLPQGLPSSYEARIGHVRYTLVAHVDRPWAFDSYARQAITVVRLMDLNTLPNLCTGGEFTSSKTLCCLCCESDPISATMRVHDRTGFVPGETIRFSAEIDNQSKRTMNATFGKLMMQVSYHATRKTRRVNNILCEVKQGKIEGGETDVWKDGKLHIPPVPPSYLQGCNIIDIKYFACMVVDPSGPGFDLIVPVEVVVGNIPLRHIAQQHGLTLPEAPPPSYDMGLGLNPTAPTAPENLYTDLSKPANLPQATFAESAFGRVSTKEEGDNEHTTGQDYAPMYAYYNWDKKPESNFTVKMDED